MLSFSDTLRIACVMKFLFHARNAAEDAEMQLLKGCLEEAGVGCFVRNENLAIARGEIPFSECDPELWILDDADLAKAGEVLASWRRSRETSAGPWVCPSCNEVLEGQFTSCWQCGEERS
jgi:hypothetical protein